MRVGTGAIHLPTGELFIQLLLGAECCTSYQGNRRNGGKQYMNSVLKESPI